MKFRLYIACLFMPLGFASTAQEMRIQLYDTGAKSSRIFESDLQWEQPRELNLHFSSEVNLISVSGADSNFLRTFHVSEDGEVISSGFMPSPYFLPNNNLIVITGNHRVVRDSFNPYGARDMGTMLLFGTLNNFISRLRIGGR